ncbi:hypothetical protein SNF32_04410 [Enterococcus mundtii]|nr:hypothetical protein [Enterococcus mundtii]
MIVELLRKLIVTARLTVFRLVKALLKLEVTLITDTFELLMALLNPDHVLTDAVVRF